MTEQVTNHINAPEPQDTPLRWLCPSFTEHEATYMVDVGASNGVGVCSCKGFQITCIKQMRENPGTIARCVHLRAVRTVMRNKMFSGRDPLDIVIELLKKEDKNNEV